MSDYLTRPLRTEAEARAGQPQKAEPEACWEHDALNCSICAADEQWERDFKEVHRLERQAKAIRETVVTNSEDRETLIRYADILEKRASQIFGRLQNEANREPML